MHFDWYLVATFWIIISALIFSSKARWLLGDLIRMGMGKQSKKYVKDDLLGRPVLDKEDGTDKDIISALMGMGYDNKKATEAAEYVATHCKMGASLEDKVRMALSSSDAKSQYVATK